ncbi:MAG: 30S ribosomal protein S9 [Candidatus Paceibacterota bacterium]
MTAVKKEVKKEKKVKKEEAANYFEAVGRRKTSVARARLFKGGESAITVNGKKLNDYFVTKEMQNIIEDPLKMMKLEKVFRVSAKVSGGGIHSQAEALRHAISRALVKFDIELRKRLKKAEFLKRDPRSKERRKFGLKKARKAPQWSKR